VTWNKTKTFFPLKRLQYWCNRVEIRPTFNKAKYHIVSYLTKSADIIVCHK